MAVNTSHKIIQRMVRSINTTPRQWRRSRGRTSSNQNKCRPKAASLVPPNVEMDVSNRRTVPGNVRSNQESIQLRPLTFYRAVRSNSTRAALIRHPPCSGVEWLEKERRPPFLQEPQSAHA